MYVVVLPDAKDVGHKAAMIVSSLIRAKPAAVLGLAAGATPLDMYGELVRRHASGELDASRLTVFGLDEYVGLGPDHPASCAYTLIQYLIAPLGLPAERVHVFDGRHAGDLLAYCAAFEQDIHQAGGIDLQILGLGVNGHIGFNEPGCSLSGRAHPLGLRASTRATNRPGFAALGEEVPRAAVSMGVANILSARRILLLATGAAKAEAVARAVEGPVSAMTPASVLQMHPDAVLLLDEAAASRLALRQDYAQELEALKGLPGTADLFG